MGNAEFKEKLRTIAARGETRITAVYVLLGALWILLSDKALFLLVPEPEAAMRVAMYKGWAYVAASAALFYFLLKAERVRVERAEASLRELNRNLEARIRERTGLLERAIQETEDIYNNAPCGHHTLDSNGAFVKINDTELAWLGYAREEVIGTMGMPDVLTPAGLGIFLKAFGTLKNGGQTGELELTFRRKDGSVFPARVSSRTVRTPGGDYAVRSVVFAAGAARSVFEEKLSSR